MRVAQNASENVVQNTMLTDVVQNAMINTTKANRPDKQTKIKEENKMTIAYKNMTTNKITSNPTVAIGWMKNGFRVITIQK